MALTLRSTALKQGETIPTEHTCDGKNLSPPFSWEGAPEGTASFLLVCDDPTATGGVFRHWAAYNIPGTWQSLPGGFGPETLEPGFMQAINDFGKPGYGGPCPPKGDRPHAYHFRLTALSSMLISPGPSATCVEIMRLAEPYRLEFVDLISFYGR